MRTLVLLALLAVLLAVFNPGMDDFTAFAREKAGEFAAGEAGRSGIGGEAGRILGGVVGGLAGSNIERVTRRDNKYLWSTYTVDLDGPVATGNEWKFLGIATQFIELQRPDALRADH